MEYATLLLEIGTEELPAGYIDPALDALSKTLVETLEQSRIQCGEARCFGTPRRLAVLIDGVAMKQAGITSELVGPPAKIGIDSSGEFTIPAKKFAQKAGASLKDIRIIKTEKGEYLAVRKVEKGVSTATVLKDVLPGVISSVPFPKTMKWGDRQERFARPVHSIAALLGSRVIRFSWADLKSGKRCRGHHFMSPAFFTVSTPASYVDLLREHHVIADRNERRLAVIQEVKMAADSLGGEVLKDDELVDMVTNLVEYPVASAGRFESRFLELPEEVLITAMRSHQKYFAVTDSKGELMPCFIAVNNTRVSDINVVTAGHERVLRARLEDAMFFYRKDLKVPLHERIDDLKRVVYQATLGTVYQKAVRIERLAVAIAQMAGFSDDAELIGYLKRAAMLCKADLVTHTVIEFPKLQGVMGRVFALACGEPEPVAKAIEEHYMPLHSGGALPGTTCGSILAVADKIDAICGCFAIGLVPTGASDPYALRRQGIGIIQIFLDRDINIPLPILVKETMAQFAELATRGVDDAATGVLKFLEGRMAQLLLDDGIPKDVVAAVLNASMDVVPDVWKRAGAIAGMKGTEEFELVAAAFKRVANIIRKSEQATSAKIDVSLFVHPSEQALYDAYNDVKAGMTGALTSGEYERALVEMAALRKHVDTFFDDVLVMDKDPALRNNRFALLCAINALYRGFADFSSLSTD